MLNLLLLIIAGALLSWFVAKLYQESEAFRQFLGWTAVVAVSAAFWLVLPLILLRAAVSGLFGETQNATCSRFAQSFGDSMQLRAIILLTDS